jgi:transposase
VAYVLNTKKLQKQRGSWKIRSGSGKGGGRPRKMTPERKKKVIDLLEKHRFDRVRAPWILKKLKLPCKLRTVQLAIKQAGYFLPALTNKRVLGDAEKKKRLDFVKKHKNKAAAFWKRRVYGDAKFWHLARTPGELAAALAQQGRVYRKKSEASDPRFHGGKAGTYKQGRRVGLFGVLDSAGVLRVAWLKRGKMNGKNFAAVAKANFASWCDGKAALVLDGERCMHGEEAAAALKTLKVTVHKLPPASPDFNPIENAWAELQKRLRKTDPGTLETEADFKARVANAVKWLEENEKLAHMVASMPSRLLECKAKKGARTSY